MINRLSRRLVVTITLATVAGATLGIGPASSVTPSADRSATTLGTVVPAPKQDEVVPDSYLVKFKDDTKPEDTPRIVEEFNSRYGGQSGHVYTAALQGYALAGSADVAQKVAGDPRVDYVIQDQYFSTQALVVQPAPPSWGIDRIDERSLPRDNKYHYPNTAPSVTAFIIDTGILMSHQEFGGRAFCGWDPYLGGCAPCGQFHGTHVAGTVGGRTVGVAKGVRIISVRVFGCIPTAPATTVIAGVNFVTLAQQLNPSMRSVANMSLGGGAFPPLDTAVTNSIAANVHYAVAAGNNFGDACNTSPARTPRATTVGATDINDTRPAFSNSGLCVDVHAPGVAVVSAIHTANNAYGSATGTSMASPHAAGTAALWRHKFPADNADAVHNAINGNATPGVVINPGTSPNLLLFMGMVPV